MDFKRLFLSQPTESMRLPREFEVKIERKTPTTVVQFDAKVKGYFVGSGGNPNFVAEEIYVNGLPNMNIRQFFPKELKELKKYALSIEYPKMFGKKLR
jgi:hypothetical protein